MKTQILLFISMFFLANLSAQEEIGDLIPLESVPESKSLMAHAQIYADAIVEGEYRKVAELTHDDVVEMGGGTEFLMGDLKSQANQLAGQNMKYVSSTVGSHPEFLTAEEELQTVLPIVFHLDMNGKKVESWINLFASSKDGGVSWKFVNLEKFDDVSLREFVKNVSAEFKFPK